MRQPGERTQAERLRDHGRLLVRRAVLRDDWIADALLDLAAGDKQQWTPQEWFDLQMDMETSDIGLGGGCPADFVVRAVKVDGELRKINFTLVWQADDERREIEVADQVGTITRGGVDFDLDFIFSVCAYIISHKYFKKVFLLSSSILINSSPTS